MSRASASQFPGLLTNPLLTNPLTNPSSLADLLPKPNLDLLEPPGSFVNSPPVPYPDGPPKLALLMVAQGDIHHGGLWKTWMRNGEADGFKVRMYIHTGMMDMQDFTPSLRQYVVPEKVQTARCDIYDALLLLINHALQDPEVTHMMVLSDDSIPVQPVRRIYAELQAKPQSRLCADENWWVPRAETWWLLHRGDAELFYKTRYDTTTLMHRWITATRDTPLTGWDSCGDEMNWYYSIKKRNEKWKGKAAFLNECPMFTDWSLISIPCQKGWADHMALCNCTNLRQGPHEMGDGGHPATFFKIDATGFQELLDSPFWFARKVKKPALLKEAKLLAKATWGPSKHQTAKAKLLDALDDAQESDAADDAVEAE
jgi:hypothetical protein